MTDIYSLSYAQELDKNDEISHFREKFSLTDQNLIYLDGNSLGVLPTLTTSHVSDVVENEWGKGLIRSWNNGWYDRPKLIGAKLAKIIGAQPDEVIMADSTSVNLFKLVYAALTFNKGRKGIISDTFNFPSDIYIIQGLIEILGGKHNIELAESDDGISIPIDKLKNLISTDTALVTLSHVVFKSAFIYNMAEVNKLAHSKGAMVIWDLSHAVGSVPINLNESNADMAIGCTYKYLNGGPGSIAFLYVRKDLQEKLQSPIWGWFGQHKPFDFKLTYQPAEGISRFLAGTPPLISLSAVEPALDLILEAGINRIREKSVNLSTYFITLFKEYLLPLGFTIGSPEDHNQRGSHISIRHPEAYRICKALIDERIGNKLVIPDFREPDNIRLGFAPLYNTYNEIFEAVMEIKDIVELKYYENFKPNRDIVT